MKRLILLVICVFVSTASIITVYAANLSYWYSEENYIGKWTETPQIWQTKIDNSGSFAFLSGITHAMSIWNDTLELSVSLTSESNASIRYYGGTKAQIDSLNLFDPVASDTLGATQVRGAELSGTHRYNNDLKEWYRYYDVDGYIVSRNDLNYNNYVYVASHELGHALGWKGHPYSTQSTWVMQQGTLENTTLSFEEKNHLAQIY